LCPPILRRRGGVATAWVRFLRPTPISGFVLRSGCRRPVECSSDDEKCNETSLIDVGKDRRLPAQSPYSLSSSHFLPCVLEQGERIATYGRQNLRFPPRPLSSEAKGSRKALRSPSFYCRLRLRRSMTMKGLDSKVELCLPSLQVGLLGSWERSSRREASPATTPDDNADTRHEALYRSEE
jgi:hypothetical protein